MPLHPTSSERDTSFISLCFSFLTYKGEIIVWYILSVLLSHLYLIQLIKGSDVYNCFHFNFLSKLKEKKKKKWFAIFHTLLSILLVNTNLFFVSISLCIFCLFFGCLVYVCFTFKYVRKKWYGICLSLPTSSTLDNAFEIYPRHHKWQDFLLLWLSNIQVFVCLCVRERDHF